ncbi:general stress protein 18-like [Littorina saxatilis]|uniref:DJ-1/PfpI domain-containing protein n=1 Tax=Littorina saxatilis TaxID=31220 RepID=A0AAN9AK13_9CAEN
MADAKKVGILLHFNFEEPEVLYPLYRFQEAGYPTVTIGPVKGTTYNGKHSYPVVADMSVTDVKAEDLSALIIPGGWSPDYLRRDPRFVNLVKDVYELGRPVAAICHGPWMFCSARILQGKKATGFVSIKDDMENAGATYVDAPVVVDGNMITSRTPADLPQFCKATLAQLS